MRWFKNVSTRTKLLLGFGLMLLLLLLLLATAYLGLSSVLQRQAHLFEVDFGQLVDVLDVDSNNTDSRLNVLMMLATTNHLDQERFAGQVDHLSQTNAALIRRLLQYKQEDPALMQTMQAYLKASEAFQETRAKQIIPLILAGQPEAAKNLVFGIQAQRYQQLDGLIRDMVDRSKADARQGLEQAERRGQQFLVASGVVGILALVLGLAIAAYLNRLIAVPLQDLARATERIAAGDLAASLPPTDRTDEVGALNQAFSRMLESLRALTRELQQTVNVLASSASQILTATSQMATSANETATSVSETTATVQEVKHTAQVSSEKAQHVAALAQDAVQASQAGRTAVEDTLSGMQRVRSQMEAIAERIVRLSEQSQAIGQIMAAVNDLAEQSNLLAINAAIEAAKAGEHGRGFAVVAQEVRSLANQSKQATAQVRGILGDIQKATSAAVMATEEGTKAAGAGLDQAAQAGQAIGLLAASIDQAAEAAGQIATAAEQQLLGTDQVAQAMEAIKGAALQTANATRQTESGARNLHDLGQRLKQLVARFKM